MEAGRLDRRITIQRAAGTTISPAGTPTQSWEDLTTRWAWLVLRSTREFIQGGAVDEETAVFRIRHLDGITTADRVVFEGRVFNIKEIVPIGRRDGLELRTVNARSEA